MFMSRHATTRICGRSLWAVTIRSRNQLESWLVVGSGRANRTVTFSRLAARAATYSPQTSDDSAVHEGREAEFSQLIGAWLSDCAPTPG